MPRPKGSVNKITSDVKLKLLNLIDDVYDSISLEQMDINQKIKFIQISLQYIIPKMRSLSIPNEEFDKDKPFIIEIEKAND
jgi:hypothetical protein